MQNSKVSKEEIPKSVKVIKSILKIIFIIGILGIPVYFLWSWASQSDTFIVKQIEVRGNTYFPDKAIIDSLQIGIGSRIFGVNLEKPRHKLEKNLFFDEVAILRSLPSTISVIIKEKVLVAWVDWENENLLLSNEGILLPHLPPTGVRNLPLISGVKPDSTKIGEVSKNKDLILVKDFLLAFDKREDESFVKNDLKTKISQIVVSVNEGMTIFLTSFNTPVIIGSDNFDVKIEKLSTFLKEMENESKSKFDSLEHIDLRYENQIVVKKKVNKNRVSNEKN